MEGSDAELHREIETRLSEALARFGIAGEVKLDEGRVILTGPGPTVSTDLGSLAAQWDQMSLPDRQRACTDVARRLAAERRPSRPAETPSSRNLLPWLAALGLVALLAAGYSLWLSPYRDAEQQPPVVRKGAGAPSAAESATAVSDSEQERAQRAARVCAATSGRISRGATVGPTDTEGWVVELSLLRSHDSADLATDPALRAFVDRPSGKSSGRFIWTGAPELVEIQGPDTRVEIASLGLYNPTAPSWRGLRLRFTGRYVKAYFEQDRRGAYLRAAHQLAHDVRASHGALYARCAATKIHQLGSWFLGPSAAESAASLVYFMGLFATAPHVKSAMTDTDAGDNAGRARVLERIFEQTKSLDRARIATVLGTHDGMISGPKTGPCAISFPFRDGNRATRASHQIARFVGLAEPL